MIGYRYKATCVNVVDGDTIDCEVDLGFHAFVKLRFRLARINAPEINSPVVTVRERAQKARSFVKSSIEGITKRVEIVSYKTEKFGRFLAEVFYLNADNELVNLNDELLAQGLADKYE